MIFEKQEDDAEVVGTVSVFYWKRKTVPLMGAEETSYHACRAWAPLLLNDNPL